MASRTRRAKKLAVVNLLLVGLSFLLPLTGPRRGDGFSGAAAAALLFLIPMAAALVVGVAGVITAAGRTWTPLAIFVFGAIVFAALAASGVSLR
jgi:hypothetical protein